MRPALFHYPFRSHLPYSLVVVADIQDSLEGEGLEGVTSALIELAHELHPKKYIY